MRHLLDLLPVGAVCLEGDSIYFNSAAERIVGYSSGEIPTVDEWFRKLYPENVPAVRAIYDGEKGAGFPEPRTVPVTRKTGELRWVEFSASATDFGEIWILNDVTERRLAEEKVSERTAEIAAYLESASQGIVTIDESGRMLMVNARTEEMFGYDRGNLIGAEVEMLLPEKFRHNHRFHRNIYFAEPRVRPMGRDLDLAGRRKDGTEFPIEIGLSFTRTKKGIVALALITDLTTLKSAQQKETLLKEIHHRVKNNLQVVSSLLGLQSRASHEEEVRRMFLESQNRIQSMALLHERLYQSDNLMQIDCRQYIGQLSAHLFRSYGVSSSRVKLHIGIQDLHLTMDAAVPCGLIINELVSNALKHAFPNGEQGEIWIEMRRDPDDSVHLRVADSGIGLPADVNLWRARSLGLRLVRTLAGQLNAAVEVKSEGGTQVDLCFPATFQQERPTA